MTANGGADYEYDLAVIGGGSGGLAVAKKAASFGSRVVLFDFVKPSPHGTKWGLGGTCVNVGCVPKKLMHYAGLLGASMHDAKAFGWKVGEGDKKPEHDWETMVDTVQNHVKMLNFRYRVGLKSAQVTYVNGLARLTGTHEVTYEKRGKESVVTASKIVIAVGGRPVIPADVPGAMQYALTSDDLFSFEKSPGKTLVIGASYIALECAGFMRELGLDVTVAVRSILLRGFDQQVAEKLGSVMNDLGVKFIRPAVPLKIEKDSDGKLEVTLVAADDKEKVVSKEVYDTVFFATGRRADTCGLGLETAGVKVNPNGKIPVDNEQTNVPHIYAIGDCTSVDILLHEAHWANPELTPVAVQVGELLANRLFGSSSEQMDYSLVATAVFTPVEYGCCGLSEEDAVRLYGENDVETYLFEFGTLEHQASHRIKHIDGEEEDDMPPTNLSKLVCLKSQKEKVLGFHFVGPNAAEVTQGFALAVRLGAKKSDFDKLVGIHPSDAESFCAMGITRSSGVSFTAEGGCGGGVCG